MTDSISAIPTGPLSMKTRKPWYWQNDIDECNITGSNRRSVSNCTCTWKWRKFPAGAALWQGWRGKHLRSILNSSHARMNWLSSWHIHVICAQRYQQALGSRSCRRRSEKNCFCIASLSISMYSIAISSKICTLDVPAHDGYHIKLS